MPTISLEALGWLWLLERGQQFAKGAPGNAVHAHGAGHALGRAKQVGQHRHGVASGVFKQHGGGRARSTRWRHGSRTGSSSPRCSSWAMKSRRSRSVVQLIVRFRQRAASYKNEEFIEARPAPSAVGDAQGVQRATVVHDVVHAERRQARTPAPGADDMPISVAATMLRRWIRLSRVLRASISTRRRRSEHDVGRAGSARVVGQAPGNSRQRAHGAEGR